MDKNNKLPDKPQQPIRFVILPLKPHLAKFLMVDWERIKLLIPEEEIKEYWQKQGQARKLGLPRLPRLIEDEGAREDRIIQFFISDMDFFLKEEPMVNDPSDIKIQHYTSRKNLSSELNAFIEKGYTLIKLTFPVKKANKYNKHLKTWSFPFLVKFSNQMLESYFIRYVRQKIEYHQNIDKALDEVYYILKLTDKDIKRNTIKRAYHRRKKDERHPLDIFEIDHLHKKIWDARLFEIYRDHFDDNISYSILATKYNLSKSTIYRVCNNPKIADLYSKVVRYNDNYFDWFLKK